MMLLSSIISLCEERAARDPILLPARKCRVKLTAGAQWGPHLYWLIDGRPWNSHPVDGSLSLYQFTFIHVYIINIYTYMCMCVYIYKHITCHPRWYQRLNSPNKSWHFQAFQLGISAPRHLLRDRRASWHRLGSVSGTPRRRNAEPDLGAVPQLGTHSSLAPRYSRFQSQKREISQGK